MREVRFRGKRNGKFIYGHGFKEFKGKIILQTSLNDFHEVEKETIGQFTGLYDINGNEIYEGDLVEYFENENSKVIYEYGSFCLEGLESEYKTSIWNLNLKRVVIGNIHE